MALVSDGIISIHADAWVIRPGTSKYERYTSV
jgi:hypothetical protein